MVTLLTFPPTPVTIRGIRQIFTITLKSLLRSQEVSLDIRLRHHPPRRLVNEVWQNLCQQYGGVPGIQAFRLLRLHDGLPRLMCICCGLTAADKRRLRRAAQPYRLIFDPCVRRFNHG